MMGKQRGTTLAAALAVAAITALPCHDTASAQTAAVPGTATATTGTGGAEPDLAYGAYQRGHFLTAFGLATHRAAAGDMKAMTLLGELYANGLGVPQNDAKADEWYRLAAARGDREAMFALAMFRLRGRAGARDRDAAAKWFAAAAKLGQPLAAYNLALLYIEGQLFPQDFKRAAELLRVAARAGNPEAQYALGTFYKEGRGVEKDMREAVRLWGLAALADDSDAQVEYAIALFNGDGVAKNEASRRGLVPQGGAARQRHRPGPARPHPRRGPRRAEKSGRGDQVAPDLQGARRDRSSPRRLRQRPRRRHPRRRRESRKTLARRAEEAEVVNSHILHCWAGWLFFRWT